jgi:hypothetical protein
MYSVLASKLGGGRSRIEFFEDPADLALCKAAFSDRAQRVVYERAASVA